jgi:hypothetical protein
MMEDCSHRLPDLTPVPAEEGDPGPWPVYSWAAPSNTEPHIVRTYTPSDGDAPRLVAGEWQGRAFFLVGVWDTATGAFVGALQGPAPEQGFISLLTYQRLDGRPRVAAGLYRGPLCIWDGDDLRLLHAIQISPGGHEQWKLAVYNEPTSGRTRLVTG